MLVLVAPFPRLGSECLSQPEAAVTWQQGGPPVLVVQGTRVGLPCPRSPVLRAPALL